MSLYGRGFLSVEKQGLLAERVHQDHAAAAVVSIGGQTGVVLLQTSTNMQEKMSRVAAQPLRAQQKEIRCSLLVLGIYRGTERERVSYFFISRRG